MRPGWWKGALIGLLGGVLGVLLMLGAKHVWQDHAALHELAVIELQRQQQAGAAK